MRHYQKFPLSPPEQIQKLKHRGLVINKVWKKFNSNQIVASTTIGWGFRI